MASEKCASIKKEAIFIFHAIFQSFVLICCRHFNFHNKPLNVDSVCYKCHEICICFMQYVIFMEEVNTMSITEVNLTLYRSVEIQDYLVNKEIRFYVQIFLLPPRINFTIFLILYRSVETQDF